MTWVRKQWDRVGAWVAIGIGAVVLVIGWFGVSSTPYPAEQLSYVFSAGMAGLFFLGIGIMLWLSADIRDEWYKLDRLEDVLRGGATDEQSARPGLIESDEASEAPVAATTRRSSRK